jgi:putative DNA primase/helicase
MSALGPRTHPGEQHPAGSCGPGEIGRRRKRPSTSERNGKVSNLDAFKARVAAEDAQPSALAAAAYNDIGTARWLIARHGHNLHYVRNLDHWLVWNGRYWETNRVAVEAMAKETLDAQRSRLASMGDTAESRELSKHLRTSGSAQHIAGQLAMARSEEAIALTTDQLDAHPWLLNVGNGTLDLRTGELRSCTRDDLLTCATDTNYDEAASAPEWHAFVQHTFGGDAELIDYAQRCMGYTLIGGNPARALIVPYGPPRTGKSTFLETIARALGPYACTTTTDIVLAGDSHAEHEAEIAMAKLLPPLRLAFAVETGEDRRFNVERVNRMAGGDTTTARVLYHGRVEFTPTFTFWLGTNHRPRADDSSGAIWDRLRPIPFRHRVSDADYDENLRERLYAEAQGVLAWLLQGVRAWQARGLLLPGVVADASREYRQEQRTMVSYLDERLLWQADLWVPTTALYADYQQWCKAEGIGARSSTAVGIALRERGAQSTRSARERGWRGVGLLDASQESLS